MSGADTSAYEAFCARANEMPDALAVVCGEQCLSFRELDVASSRLAHHLRERRIQRGELVGIFLERSVDLLVAVLGTLKSGAAYVPLEPSYPQERLSFMLSDSRVRAVITCSDVLERLPAGRPALVLLDADAGAIEGHPCTRPDAGTKPDDLAYVIYTSGSTGHPEGVMIEHRNVVNLISAMALEPGLSPGETMVGVTTHSFDLSVPDLYLPLACGATLMFVPHATASDGAALAELLARVQPELMQATPSTWRMLIDAGWTGSDRLRAVCGGEALQRDLALALLERVGGGVWNFYGPTETTVWVTRQRLGPEVASGPAVVPIGSALAGARCHILDQAGNLVSAGSEGELYIGGPGVARGYHRRPGLTAECFVPDRLGGSGQLYRTGDLVRSGTDGVIEFIGRADHQVKLRGFRIELGEVEVALSAEPTVREAVVVLTDDAPGEERLVAYVVPAPGTLPRPEQLRAAVQTRLPQHMVPGSFTLLDELPKTPNGKIDRNALSTWRPAAARDSTELIAPRTVLEHLVLGVWTEVLGHGKIGVGDDFFAVGGHSLRAMQVSSRLRTALGVRVPLGRLLEHRTVAGQARVVADCLAEEKEAAGLLAQLEAS